MTAMTEATIEAVRLERASLAASEGDRCGRGGLRVHDLCVGDYAGHRPSSLHLTDVVDDDRGSPG